MHALLFYDVEVPLRRRVARVSTDFYTVEPEEVPIVDKRADQ
jgi:hypothetical protein